MMQNDRWTTVAPWFFSAEPTALEPIRQSLPDNGPHRAWANFSFVADTGHLHSVDLLVAGPDGLHLLEIDVSQGQLRDENGIWLRTRNGTTTASDSTRDVAAVKARHLTAVLRRAAAGRFLTVPAVRGSAFLSDPRSSVDLTGPAAHGVFGPDGPAGPSLPGVTRDLLGQPASDRAERPGRRFLRALPGLLNRIGMHPVEHWPRVGTWQLTAKPVALTDRWQDFVAWSTVWDKAPCRVRVYAPGTSRTRTDEAVLREYLLLREFDHPGIVTVDALEHHPPGPVLMFHVEKKQLLRLDHILALYRSLFTPAVRAGMIRQIGAGLAHAHARQIAHRALSTRAVMGIPRPAQGESVHDGWRDPGLQITDWHHAAVAAAATEGAPDSAAVARDLRALPAVAQEICAGTPAPGFTGLPDRLATESGFARLHPAEQVRRLTDRLAEAALSPATGPAVPVAG
ncbi:protein kinase [Streptomyces sp. NPDC057966]|uniref:protein kinase n=1 Tax=Streptomyces sp. NPDC057966 TaxID=3346292 RepID=UPI0036E575E6